MDTKWNDWEFLVPLQEFVKRCQLSTVKITFLEYSFKIYTHLWQYYTAILLVISMAFAFIYTDHVWFLSYPLKFNTNEISVLILSSLFSFQSLGYLSCHSKLFTYLKEDFPSLNWKNVFIWKSCRKFDVCSNYVFCLSSRPFFWRCQ